MGLVQSQAKPKSWLTKVPVGAEIIKFGPKWVENRRFGPKQRPNESYGLSGPIRTTPEAKNGKKTQFLRKTAPGGRPGGTVGPRFIGPPRFGVLCKGHVSLIGAGVRVKTPRSEAAQA